MANVTKKMGGVIIEGCGPEASVFFIPNHEIRDTIQQLIKAYGNFPPREDQPKGLTPTNQEA
jgi:hypothetical protein